MKYNFILLIFCLLVIGIAGYGQVPQKISYQGLLTASSGQPVQNGSYGLQFDIYNLPSGGTLRHTETHTAVSVSNGTFSVILGPLPVIFSESLYVEVTALSGPGISGSITFSPRSELTSSPYSLAPWAANGNDIFYNSGKVGIGTNSPNCKFEVRADNEPIRASNATDPGRFIQMRYHYSVGPLIEGAGYTRLTLDADTTGAGKIVLGQGGDNVGIGTINPASPLEVSGIIHSTAGGFKFPDGTIQITAAGGGANSWNLNGNAIAVGNFLGTTNNQPLEFRVNNIRGYKIVPSAGTPNIIGGFSGNNINLIVVGGTIAGGGTAGNINAISGNYGTIGGGMANSVNNTYGTIAGGQTNTVNGQWATVGGGVNNQANQNFATVPGGDQNNAGAQYATVGGGWSNSVSGSQSIIGGGVNNNVSGAQGTIGGGSDNKVTDDYGTVGGGSNNTSGNNDGIPANAIYATISGGNFNTANNNYSSIGGGTSNNVSADTSTIGGGALNNILIASDASTIGGGTHNTAASQFGTIGGGTVNTIQPNSNYGTIGGGINNNIIDNYATIGGGADNNAGIGLGSGIYATVGGGGGNMASGSKSTIAGGWGNNTTAFGTYSFIGGGTANQDNASWTTIGGGFTNIASNSYATIGGGMNNIASGQWSVVGGGSKDSATADYTTVPGGADNKASGMYSFAAGRRAKALHSGCFVWADQTNADFPSLQQNEFRVRANGGARFDVAVGWVDIGSGGPGLINTSAGGAMLTLGGIWQNGSDRNLKDNITPVDNREILKKIAMLPVSIWNYKIEGPSIKHIGPMAQDFYSIFGVGNSDKTISTIDPSGVALAAVQELYKENQELAVRVEKLEAIVKSLISEKKSGADKSLGELR